jgi:hypothetical protein
VPSVADPTKTFKPVAYWITCALVMM